MRCQGLQFINKGGGRCTYNKNFTFGKVQGEPDGIRLFQKSCKTDCGELLRVSSSRYHALKDDTSQGKDG